MIASRRPQSTRNRMATPSTKMTAMAVCQPRPMLPHRVKATIELMPMPEAQASGRFENTPIAIVITAAPRQVAVTAAVGLIPAADRMLGLTMMMYAMAKNVVRPARTSVAALEPRSENLKNVSITPLFFGLLFPTMCSEAPVSAPRLSRIHRFHGRSHPTRRLQRAERREPPE